MSLDRWRKPEVPVKNMQTPQKKDRNTDPSCCDNTVLIPESLRYVKKPITFYHNQAQEAHFSKPNPTSALLDRNENVGCISPASLGSDD